MGGAVGRGVCVGGVRDQGNRGRDEEGELGWGDVSIILNYGISFRMHCIYSVPFLFVAPIIPAKH